jgi:formamidopyrimidine-DNA glycosylase
MGAMPELPEVETMVRGLRRTLAGARLEALEILDPLLLEKSLVAQAVVDGVAGAQVQAVERRGKWVVIVLEARAGVIVIQPRMTGGFWLVAPPHERHVRLIFRLEDLAEPVRYCDARRLGKMAWYADLETAERACRRSQGPDALVMTRNELAQALARTSRGIKPSLMDQKVVSGIGNIYADEILWRSTVHPMVPANRLKAAQVARIHEAIRPVLEQAIAAEGSSFDAGYRTVLGLEGGFLAENDVHRRGGQPCKRCGRAIEKAYLEGLIGRPTYYCPTCQRKPRTRASAR